MKNFEPSDVKLENIECSIKELTNITNATLRNIKYPNMGTKNVKRHDVKLRKH